MQETAIVIINWNGWKDTVECLSSFEWPVADVHFFILDNLSTDDSVVRLENYLTGRSISYSRCGQDELGLRDDTGYPVTLVLNSANQGFAGGNNVILRYLLRTDRFSHAWLLNNDTVVKKDSLAQMLKYMEGYPRMAFCGSVVLDYYKPELIQCCGVNYYRYLGVSKLYLKDRIWMGVTPSELQAGDTSTRYQIGASLLADMEKLRHVGLMDEIFFMYSEEADWQIRAKSLGYGNGLAPESIIYHKGNVSTVNKKHLFFYHYNRSAIILTRKNFGLFATLTATFSLAGITAIRSRFALKAMWYGLKGMAGGWLADIKKTS
jgi:GT2 family glycosyltransferase